MTSLSKQGPVYKQKSHGIEVAVWKREREDKAFYSISINRTYRNKDGEMIESLTLPPDPDGKNNDRAAWAMRAIRAFMAETGTAHIIATSDRLETSGRV